MIKLKFISSLLISVSCLATISNSANAQITDPNQPPTFQSNEVDPLTGTSGFNPLDLIHNANLLNGRSGAEFAADSNEQIDDAASEFKKQQLQRMLELQQQQNSTPDNGNPDLNPSP